MSLVTELSDEFPVLFVDFNQDHTCLCIGTKSGYLLVNVQKDNIFETFSSNSGSMCCVSRLFTSSLVTFVCTQDLRKLIVHHFKRDVQICDYRYTFPVLAVKMNRQRLVVCVENQIFIHNIHDMQMMHKIEDTPSNRNGVIALSPNEKNCYLAFPGSHSNGTVFLFNASTFKNYTSIAAHDGLLAALEFNSSATLLATASDKGTVIRIFSVAQGNKVMEFRRGIARCAQISSLTFSVDDQYLVSSSNTETVHVFKLDSRKPTDDFGVKHRIRTVSGSSQHGDIADEISPREDMLSSPNGKVHVTSCKNAGWGGGLMDWMGSAIKASAAYLPQQVSEVFQQDRAFSWAKIPSAHPYSTGSRVDQNDYSSNNIGFKKVAAIVYVQDQTRLLVAGLDGLLHIFSIDPVNGGEATFIRTHKLLGSPGASSFAQGDLTRDPQAYPGVVIKEQRPGASFASVAGNVSASDLASAEISSAAHDNKSAMKLLDNKEFPPIS